MNDVQYTRYKNALNTKMDCLFSTRDTAGNMHFLIESSQRYKVSIYLHDGSVTCSCPDYTCRSRTEQCVCKHCVYVLMRHLKLVNSLDHAFFGRSLNNGPPFLVKDELAVAVRHPVFHQPVAARTRAATTNARAGTAFKY